MSLTIIDPYHNESYYETHSIVMLASNGAELPLHESRAYAIVEGRKRAKSAFDDSEEVLLVIVIVA